jgi:hypothetical protein
MKTNILPPILDRCDGTPNPLPDVIISEMFLFVAIIVQMGTTCVAD